MAKILLVDDVYTARSMIERVLSRVGGYEVHAVGSGAEAVTAVTTAPPDLIILDVSMAGMDGPATLTALRNHGVNCPIVAYTARKEARSGEFVAHGFDAYIAKNGDLSELLTRVRELVGK
jgi:two-component system OmpR family response regulator